MSELNKESVEQAGGDERVSLRGEANLAFNALHECVPAGGAEKQYSDAIRALETALRDIAYSVNRTATPQQFSDHLQREARAALAQPSPVRSSLLINGYQLRAALDFIAPDGTAEQLESETCIEWRQQDADFLEAGLYAFCAEYPEEGGVLLDEEPTIAQPSPLQSEQAEAERPEMSPERAAYFMRRFKSEEKLLGPNEQAAVDYVLSLLAQHESIVGALRAELESERNRVNIYVNNNGIRQDNERLRAELRAALARVAEQQTEIEWLKNPKALAETVHADAQEAVKLQRLLMDSHTACRPAGEGLMGWAHAALSAQAQHSVPEGWKLVPVEPTEDVLEAIHNGGYVGDDQELRQFYQDILDAAPAPGGE
ncbi:hypothetical protein L4Z93_000913 [Pseudomonas aeruginosa]|nr:hypothetical protein [Pseudomonas aeruginosa]